jgi:hypothetical protein
MARAQDEMNSLRFGRRERAVVIAAVLFSLLLHLGGWGVYLLGNRTSFWQKLHLPEWVHLAKAKTPPPPIVQTNDPEPTTYVDVSHADADAPAVAQYYSSKNSRAANRETAQAKAPKINGRQSVVPKTEDVPRAPKKVETIPNAEPSKTETVQATSDRFGRLLPAMPLPTLARNQRPSVPQVPGETDERQPTNSLSEPPQPPEPPGSTEQRPRTLRQALAQQNHVAGEAMQQDGGVQRRALFSSLDAKATPFGDYDGAIISAVQQRWSDLLDSRRFAQDRTGRVVLRFKLMSDGSVIEMETLENGVGELLGYLCQESIEEAAPFAKWPPDMSRMIGTNYRVVTFAFYYY